MQGQSCDWEPIWQVKEDLTETREEEEKEREETQTAERIGQIKWECQSPDRPKVPKEDEERGLAGPADQEEGASLSGDGLSRYFERSLHEVGSSSWLRECEEDREFLFRHPGSSEQRWGEAYWSKRQV